MSDKDENVKPVMTRLTDNHPLTMEDRDPRYYLQHLTEDQLEENVPVFEEDREEMPDEFATTKRRVTKDAFGHRIEVVETIPSQKEQDLANSGVYFPNDSMYGYTPDTPLVLTVKDDLVDYDDKDDLAAGIITNKDGEVISSKSGETTVETKADEPTQEEPGSNDLQEMTEDGDYLAACPLVPGGAVQTEIEVHREDITPGLRVVIVDDLIATGGTLEAAVHLVEQLGAKVVKIVCLLELKGLHGRDRLTSCPTEAVVSYEGK